MEKNILAGKTALPPSMLPGALPMLRPSMLWALQLSGPNQSLQNLMHFRYYASSMGKFMKPDNIITNIANPQSWNLYSYVNGNPVNFNDPTGHFTMTSATLAYVMNMIGGASGMASETVTNQTTEFERYVDKENNPHLNIITEQGKEFVIGSLFLVRSNDPRICGYSGGLFTLFKEGGTGMIGLGRNASTNTCIEEFTHALGVGR